jgi:hypothetical protein
MTAPEGGAPGASGSGDLGLARAIAAAVGALPGVAAVGAGRIVPAATYGPGGVVRGVEVRHRPGAAAVAVHLSAAYAPGLDLPALAARVRRAVAGVLRAHGAGPRPEVDVVIDDLWLGPPRPEGAAGADG